jgi:hypothetical protein
MQTYTANDTVLEREHAHVLRTSQKKKQNTGDRSSEYILRASTQVQQGHDPSGSHLLSLKTIQEFSVEVRPVLGNEPRTIS